MFGYMMEIKYMNINLTTIIFVSHTSSDRNSSKSFLLSKLLFLFLYLVKFP
jgi:hypothetical protein